MDKYAGIKTVDLNRSFATVFCDIRPRIAVHGYNVVLQNTAALVMANIKFASVFI
jgi:hypothetical protein